MPKTRAASLGALVGVVFLTACGGGDKPDPQQAFLQSMVPHHRSAVDMAAVAETDARTDFVKGLAKDISRTQVDEIGQMERLHERLFRAPLKPDMGAHSALGLSAQEARMNHMEGAATIRGKKPFDRAFIDGMVPHHEGAVRMAEAVRAEAEDPQLRGLAEEIVAAQKKEIAAMTRFRAREYGVARAAPATAGGHPAGHGG